MSESDDILKKLKKNFGDSFGHKGPAVTNTERMPTGIFNFDLATGGGFPKGRVSILYGMESSGKSTIAYKLAAQCQREGKVAVIVDLENSYDTTWATVNGVVTEELILVTPESAEQAVDAVEAFMYAADVGLVVLDSIGAMVTHNEIESEAGKQIVAGASMMVTKMMKKSGSALTVQRNQGNNPILLLVNQIRHKIGAMYDPETIPGGNMLRFSSSLTIRLYGKDVMKKEVSETMPATKQVSAIIKKNKIPVLAKNFEYDLCLFPHDGLKLCESSSWSTVSGFLKDYGYIAKEGTSWKCGDESFPTLGAIKERFMSDINFKFLLQNIVVEKELGNAQSLIS